MDRLFSQLKNIERYDIQYNNATSHSHGVFLYDYPEISQAKKNYDTYLIPGRDGELISSRECRGNITINCTFSVLSEQLIKDIRGIKEWLSGMGNLVLSDSPESFYEVLKIEYGEIDRELRKYGRFTASFICYPYEFMNDGQHPVSGLVYNPYDRCMPIYEIKGEGTCNLSVNGNVMTANVGQNMTIDTRRMLSYRKDGTMNNTSVTGDYETLWLNKGENELSITNGFKLMTTPRWGYEA